MPHTQVNYAEYPAYQQATALKAETLALMDKATEPYQQHRKEVEILLLDVEKAYEYAKGIPKNKITVEQWELIKRPSGNLLGGFVRTWRSQGTTSPGYITEKKNDIADAFDLVICLEINKKEAKACNVSNGGN